MPQIMDGKSSRWNLYQTGSQNADIGTGTPFPLEVNEAKVIGAHGGVFLATLYGIVDPAGTLINEETGCNEDKYVMVYDANPTQADADMKYPRLIIPVKSKGSFFYDAPWEEWEFFHRWPSDPEIKKEFSEGRFAPYNEGVRVYLSSTMDRLTIIQNLLGITQARTMLCNCG